MAKYQDVIIAGFGGQGVMLIGNLLAQAGMEHGLEVSFIPVYGAEMRGGTANCTVVLDEHPVGSPLVNTPRSIIVLNEPSLAKFQPRLHPDGVGDDALVQPAPRRIDDDRLRADAAPRKLRGGLARVGAEKFALVRKMIPLGVVPRVFHGGGNDLCADDARVAGGHAKADRPRAAVEIERRHARRDTGIAERGLIQPLGLRRVHLEKRAGREREREAAQPLGEHLAAPNGIKLSGKHGVAAGRVAVEYEPGYIRAALA